MPFVCGNIYVYHCNWIKPPHDKIALCVHDNPEWVFWFNSKPKSHGQGQLTVDTVDHPTAIRYSSYLDLSGVKAVSPNEVAVAQNRGPISAPFKAKIMAALALPIKTLPPTHLSVALNNLK